MGRKLSRLTLDSLEELPEHCRNCVFWELDAVRRGQVRGHEAEEKAAWLSYVLREWGSVGQVLYVDDEYAGHAIWAPAVFLPGSEGFATAPVSPDAVVLATMHIDPRLRHGGLGRVLVQTMARDVIRRGGIRAVEAFGDTRNYRGLSSGCVLPADFLLAVGFATHRAHATYPRMRMELRNAITWRSEIEHALSKLVPRPRRVPGVTAPGHGRATVPIQRSPRSARPGPHAAR